MTHQLIKAVKALSHFHRRVTKSYCQFATYASNPKYFPKVATVMILSSSCIGLGVMEIVNRQREANNMSPYVMDDTKNKNSRSMSEDEYLVRAMIENAKASSSKENLENAILAQKNFMLIPFDQSVGNDSKDRQYLQRIGRKMEDIKSKTNGVP